jgi:hypothetical protein
MVSNEFGETITRTPEKKRCEDFLQVQQLPLGDNTTTRWSTRILKEGEERKEACVDSLHHVIVAVP